MNTCFGLLHEQPGENNRVIRHLFEQFRLPLLLFLAQIKLRKSFQLKISL